MHEMHCKEKILYKSACCILNRRVYLWITMFPRVPISSRLRRQQELFYCMNQLIK